MRQNTRYVLLVCNVAAVMFGGVSWIIPASKEPGVWWFRIGAPIVLILVAALFLRAKRRGDQAPDFFSKLAGTFFERDGFAFIVTTEVHDGACHLCVWYQNRYERDCEAEVMVRTSERWLAPQRHLPDARVKIMCGPAAFGKAIVPWATAAPTSRTQGLARCHGQTEISPWPGQVGALPVRPFGRISSVLRSHRPAQHPCSFVTPRSRPRRSNRNSIAKQRCFRSDPAPSSTHSNDLEAWRPGKCFTGQSTNRFKPRSARHPRRLM